MRSFVYYFLNCFLSILLGISVIENNKIAFLIILILIVHLYINKRFTNTIRIVFVVITFVSFISTISYYSVCENDLYFKDFRVSYKTSKDVILTSKSFIPKKYIIKDFKYLENIDEGMILSLDGSLIKSTYYDIGVVGEILDYKINDVKVDFWYKFIYMRNVINDFFISNLGNEKGNILSSLAFGYKEGLTREYKENLSSMGLSHILSVSGVHLNIIFEFISKILSLFPSLFVSFIYLLFTGSKVSSIRAFVMLFLKQIAPRIYRVYDGINALCFVGVLILVIKSYEIFNMGFIYSFLATLGILMFNKKINNYFYKFPKLLADSISLILSAQVFIFPIMLILNRKLEFGFLLSNIFLVPFYGILMVLGVLLIFFRVVPFLREGLLVSVKILFAIIDGGERLIKIFVPDGVYINDSVLIFLFCLYLIYFLSNKIEFKKVILLPLIVFCFYTVIATSIHVEFGKYFDRDYVIFRSGAQSYMYVDRKFNSEEVIKDKLDVEKIFSGNENKEFKLFGKDICVNFGKDGKITLSIDKELIEIINKDFENKYYSSIYPRLSYFIF